MKKTGIIMSGFGFVLICSYSLWFFAFTGKAEKTAYVNIGKLYNDFQMKKELESKLTNVQETRKTILDSLELQLKVLSKQLDIAKNQDEERKNAFISIREEYLTREKQFAEDNEAMTRQYYEQIMKQLNQYVKEYGVQNNYSYIFGAEGSGAIMYSKEELDITQSVSDFVNERYKGKK